MEIEEGRVFTSQDLGVYGRVGPGWSRPVCSFNNPSFTYKKVLTLYIYR